MALVLRLASADAQSFVIDIFESTISALCLTVHMQRQQSCPDLQRWLTQALEPRHISGIAFSE